MKWPIILCGLFLLLGQEVVAQTLPLKWEVNLGIGFGGAIYLGKIDANKTGKILIAYWSSTRQVSGYVVYDGTTDALQHIDTSGTSGEVTASPFGIQRIAPPFQADFDTNGIADIYQPPGYAGGAKQWAFFDPSTGARTVVHTYANQCWVIDADDIDNDGIYELIVFENDNAGNGYLRVYNTGRQVTTSVQETNIPSPKFNLNQNYPNPFNPSTRIQYDLPTSGSVGMEIFDISGRSVRVYEYPYQSAGSHEMVWDGKDNAGTSVSTGTYLYRLVVNGASSARKMLLLR